MSKADAPGAKSLSHSGETRGSDDHRLVVREASRIVCIPDGDRRLGCLRDQARGEKLCRRRRQRRVDGSRRGNLCVPSRVLPYSAA